MLFKDDIKVYTKLKSQSYSDSVSALYLLALPASVGVCSHRHNDIQTTPHPTLWIEPWQSTAMGVPVGYCDKIEILSVRPVVNAKFTEIGGKHLADTKYSSRF